MPTIGGVYIPDELAPRLDIPEPQRPSYGDILSGAAQGAYGAIRYGLPLQAETLAGTLDAEDERGYVQGLRETGARASRAAPASTDELLAGRVGVTRFLGENLVASLPYMASAVVGAIGGGLAGGAPGAIAGGIAGGVPQFSGTNVARAVEETGGLTEDAALRSAAIAVPQAAADFLLARYLPGAGKFLGSAAATQTGKGFLSRTAQSMAKAGGTEALTEAAQQMGERYAAGLSISDADAAAEYVNAAVVGLGVGGVLGAGGGFRRTNALAKNPAEVTIDDLTTHIDQIIQKAMSSGQEQQLDLGLSGGSAPEQQLDLPMQPLGPEAELPASALPQLPLDPPLSRVPPETQLNLGDRFRDNITPQELPAAAAVSPELEQMLAEAIPVRPDPLMASTSRLAMAPPNTAVPAVELPPDAVRPFAEASIEDVEKVARSKEADNTAVRAARQELRFRREEVAGSRAPTADFQQRLAELKRGLRGGFVNDVTALDPIELQEKVYDQVFTEADTRSNTEAFAKRLGILDENGNPGPAALEVEARRAAAATEAAAAQAPAAPAAPAAPEIAPPPPAPATPLAAGEWKRTLRKAGIQRLRGARGMAEPKTLEEGEAMVVAALAEDASQVELSQVEKAAQTLGLITNDDARDFTPKGRTAYLRTPDGLEAKVQAAQRQGYTGALASIFDRGAQSVVNGVQDAPAFSGFEELAAYQAGQVWARDFIDNGPVRTAAQTEATRRRLEARATARPEKKPRTPRKPLTPEQIRQQSLNNLVDAANLSTTKGTEIAELRRRIREGATAAEVETALGQLQEGRSLFAQPEAAPVEFTPAQATRGQPLYREIPQPGPSRAEQRAETERAVLVRSLNDLIDIAEGEEAIPPSRANGLRRLLDRGQVDKVAQILKDFDPDAEPEPPKKARVNRIKDPVALQQAVIHDQLTGREKVTIARHYGEKTYNARAKQLFAKDVRAAINKGLDAVAEAIRGIIQRIGEGVLALAMVFNPAALTTPDVAFAQVPLKSAGVVAVPKNIGLSTQAQAAYQRLAPLAQQEGKGFMIVDKANSTLHLFRKDGSHIASDTVLTGATQADFFTPDRAMAQRAADVSANDRVTPAGLFTAKLFRQSNAEGMPLGLMLKDAQGKTSMVAIHTTVLDNRLQDLAEGRLAVTLGCVSVDPEFYRTQILPDIDALVDNFVFVLPYDATQMDELLPEAADTPLADPPMRDPNKKAQLEVADRRAIIEVMEAADAPQPAFSATRLNAMTSTAVKRLAEAADNFNPIDKGVRLRRVGFGWISHNMLERAYGRQVEGLAEHGEAWREQMAARARLDQIGDEVYQRFERLERAKPQHAEWVGKMMRNATEFQLDPDKAWENHTHLENAPDKAQLQKLHQELVKLANDMRRGDGEAMAVFNDFRAANEAQNLMRMATLLHGHIAMDPELAMGVQNSSINPFDRFMREEGLVTPQEIRDRWTQLLDEQIMAVNAFIKEKKGEVEQGSEAERSAMSTHLSPIEHQIRAIYQARAAMSTAPYFHLGRFGDYFAAGTVANAEGVVDPAALATLAKALELAGFNNVQISPENSKPRFMIRVETADEMIKLRTLLARLQQEGVLAENEISAGPRERAGWFGVGDGLPDYVQHYIQALEASPMFQPPADATADEREAIARRRDDAIRLAVDTWLEQQPDTSISKVLVKRYTIQGYDPDMVRNWSHRWRVGSVSIASSASRPKFNSAFQKMRNALEQSKRVDPDTGEAPGDSILFQDIMDELRRRDARNPMEENIDALDRLRAIGHSYFLGFSPAYAMINLTQLGVTALPELAKKHGYRRSFSAMRQGSALAGRILVAAASEARELGPKNWADVAITERVLRKAGLSDQDRNFVLQMIATGTIDIGSAARALAQVAESRQGSKLDIYLRYASSFGLYTETFSRLTTAIAARRLHQGDNTSAEKYAARVVSETMFDYQSWNTARQLGKQGFLGPVTPIVTQFMSYTVQVTEKIYSEFMGSIRGRQEGETEAEAETRRKEARTWMFGHVTAVTALAGSLGMPFATAFSAVIERLVDAFDDDEDPYDATAAWRNFLSDTFGQDVGEILARGLPRAVGFDISQRVGEADLLPFSALLSDRRTLRESIEGYLGRAIGASPNMLLSIGEGLGAMTDGDVMAGMKALVPVAFKGPIETYRMTTDGYVDTRGNRLPLSPNASAYLWQILGFAPAERAEYSEARRDQQARRGDVSREAGKLRQDIVYAMMEGDNETARDLIAKAVKFDRDNPSFAVVPSLANSLRRQARQRAMAQALQTPIGVSMNDIAGQELTRYANIEVTQ